MIIRRHGDIHYILPQPEHARQCAMIVAHLRTEFLGDGDQQAEILTATRHHDDGWAQWEANPRYAENGLPVNFLEMNSNQHHEIWYRTVFDNERLRGRAVATIIGRHGAQLMQSDDAMREHYLGVLDVIRKGAWMGLSEEESIARMEHGFSALYFADALSLAANAGLDKRWELELRRADGTIVPVNAWLEKDWTVRVDPWPFCLPRLDNMFVNVVTVPAGAERFSEDYLHHRPDQRVRIKVDYVPV